MVDLIFSTVNGVVVSSFLLCTINDVDNVISLLGVLTFLKSTLVVFSDKLLFLEILVVTMDFVVNGFIVVVVVKLDNFDSKISLILFPFAIPFGLFIVNILFSLLLYNLLTVEFSLLDINFEDIGDCISFLILSLAFLASCFLTFSSSSRLLYSSKTRFASISANFRASLKLKI